MKQDEVLQTLREVIEEAENFTTWTVSTPHLVELVKRAVEAEREENAKLCEDHFSSDGDWCAAAIRARGETAPPKEIDPNKWAFDNGLEST